MVDKKAPTTLEDLIRLAHWLNRLCAERHFGTIELTLHDGTLVNIKQNQSHNPENLLGKK